MTTTTMPTSRAPSATQATGTSAADLPVATRPTPKTSAAPTESSAARRVSIGRSPRGRRRVVARRPRSGAGAVERVGDDVEVAGRDIRPDRLERGRGRPRRDDAEHQPCGDADRVAEGYCDERRDRAFRGDDRRDDRDLADAQRRIRQLQPDDVADPRKTRAKRASTARASLGAGAEDRIGKPTMTPTTMTQPSTTREPSIRLERDEQRVATAQSTAAPRPPMMATTESVWRVADACRASRVVAAVLCYHPPSRPALVPRRVPSTTHINRGSRLGQDDCSDAMNRTWPSDDS